MKQHIAAIRGIDRGLAAAILLLCVSAGGFLYLVQVEVYGDHFWSGPSGLMLRDFGFFWGGARLAWLGHAAMVFDPGQFNAWLAHQVAPGTMEPFATWSYPPTMLLPLLPFAILPPPFALLLWLGATFGLLALVLGGIFRDWRLVVAVVLSPAAFYSFSFGQNGALTAALLIAGLWMSERRPVLAGICCGLLIIKPQLGLLLPFALAAGRHWRAFASAGATSLAVLLLSLALFGVAPWYGFFHATMPHMSAQLLHEWGIPPQYAMPTMLVTLQGWGLTTHQAGYGQALGTLAAIAAVSWAWRLPTADRRWRVAMVCAAALLATPFGYVYDMIPAMLAVALVAEAGFRSGFAWYERPILIAVWIWPAATVPWTYCLGLPPLGGFALLALLPCIAGRMARQSATAAQSVPPILAAG